MIGSDLIKNFLYCFLTISYGFGQEFQVLNIDSNEPVSFANINFLNGSGVVCNEEGIFKLESTKNIDSLHITAIGYFDKKISIDKLLNKTKVYLKKDIIGLDEIVVKNKKSKILKHTGKLPHLNLDVDGFGYDEIFVTFIPFPEQVSVNKKVLIKNILVNTTGLRSKKRRYYPFKVNLLAVNTQREYPNIQDTLLTSVLASRKKGEKSTVKINVEDYNIELPKSGIFVAFETLTKEEYSADEHYKTEKFIYFQDTKGHNNYAAAVKRLKVNKNSKSYSYRQKTEKYQKKNGDWVKNTYWRKQNKYIYDLTIEVEF